MTFLTVHIQITCHFLTSIQQKNSLKVCRTTTTTTTIRWPCRPCALGITFWSLCTSISFITFQNSDTNVTFIPLRLLCSGITFRPLCRSITFRPLRSGISFITLRAPVHQYHPWTLMHWYLLYHT